MKNITLYGSWLEDMKERFSQEEIGELISLMIEHQETGGWGEVPHEMFSIAYFLAIRRELEKQYECQDTKIETILHKDILEQFNWKEGFTTEYDSEKDQIIIKKIK